jgi:Uncharacterized protein conserved in bacteria
MNLVLIALSILGINIAYVSIFTLRLILRIEADSPKAFVISHVPRHFRSGFWAKMLEK